MSSNVSRFYFIFITVKVTALLHYIPSVLAIRKEAKSNMVERTEEREGWGWWVVGVLFVIICMTSW